MTQTYAKRFAQVFDYIDRHLDEALTVEKTERSGPTFRAFTFNASLARIAASRCGVISSG